MQPSNLSSLSDAALVQAMARAGATYPSREYSAAKAEAERRGIERVRAASHAVAIDEERGASALSES